MGQGGLGFARAFRTGLLAGLVVVVVAGAALGAYVLRSGHLPGRGRTDTDRVLVVAALPDENGALVAQVIALVDTTGGTTRVSSIDTSLAVTIPGTTFSHLRDAYSFGGGARVAAAYAEASGAEAPPYVDLGPEAVNAAVDAAGGIELNLPQAMNVFDGDRLYTFEAGSVRVGASELRAVLNGMAYLPRRDREALQAQLAERMAGLVAEYPGGITAALEGGAVASDMDATAAQAFAERLAR